MKRALKAFRGVVAAGAVTALVQGVGAVTYSPLADAANGPMTATTTVNVRRGPGTSNAKVGILYPGQSVTAIGTSGGWTRVKWKGGDAFIASAYLRTAQGAPAAPAPAPAKPQGAAFYTGAHLNLRTGPGTKYPVHVVAPKGAVVHLTGKASGGFTQLVYQGKTLWGAQQYLHPSSPAPVASLPKVTGKHRATVALMIRTSPGQTFTNLGDVPRGTILDTTGLVTRGMAQVIYQGQVRWVNAKYLEKVGSTPAPTAPTPPKTTVRYATANLNVWTGPTGSANIGEIPRGSELAVTGQIQSGRAQILYKGVLRWVTARYTATQAPGSPAPTTPAKPPANTPKTTPLWATAALNIWTASKGSAYEGEIPRHSELASTGVARDGRTQIVHRGQLRWVTSRYTTASKPSTSAPAPSGNTTVWATTQLNLWTGPTGPAYVGEIPKGTQITSTGVVQSGRRQVIYRGTTRWVTAMYTTTVKPGTTPPSTGSPSLNRGWSSGLDRANIYVQTIAQYVWDNFPMIKTQYGWRHDEPFSDHPMGRAVDIMIPDWKSTKATGQMIAEFFRANHKRFHVHYIIWDQKIWNIKRDKEGWRPMADRGGHTANHLDHVHISVFDAPKK